MSALGCGVAYGLGHEDALYKILREDWQSLRFFLCYPLGTVPTSTRSREYIADLFSSRKGIADLLPLDRANMFLELRDRSAALVQLLLSTMSVLR